MTVWIDILLGALALVITYIAHKYKKKTKDILILLDEIEKSMQDEKLTDNELREIVKQIKTIIER